MSSFLTDLGAAIKAKLDLKANSSDLANKVDKITGKSLSTEDYTTAEKTKLAGLSNYSAPASQPISYVTGLQTSLDGKVDKITGKQLSTEDYTTAEKTKLAGVPASGILSSSDIGNTVQGYDATTLKSSAIGVSVQGYDVNTAKTNANQTFTKAQRAAVGTVAYAASVTLDLSANNHFAIALTGNITVANPTNLVAGQEGTITLTQDATGGRTVAWGTNFKWVGGTAPTYVTTANSKSTYVYHVVSSTEIIVVPLIDWK